MLSSRGGLGFCNVPDDEEGMELVLPAGRKPVGRAV